MQSDPATRRTPSLRVLLIASLALNLFLLAFVAAQYWQGRSPSPPTSVAAGAAFKQVAAALPPQDGEILRGAVAAQLPRLVVAQRGLRDAMATVRDEVRRDPVDTARLRAAIETARGKRMERMMVIEDILTEAISRMSEPGRQILSQFRLGK